VRYLVKYIVADIVASSVVIIDDDSNDIAKDIAKKLAINCAQILKYNREYGRIKKIIQDDDLLIILSTLEATHLSGLKTLEQSLVDTILDFYPNDKNLKNQTKIWAMKNLSLTAMLDSINVDKVIIILLESGGAGDMSQAFKEAKKYLKLSSEESGLYKTDILSNISFSALSLGLILGMPFMLADPYNKIIKAKKIAEPVVITLINFIVDNIGSIVFASAAIVTLAVFSFTNQRMFNRLMGLQPWKSVADLQNLKSAMNFLPIYTTLKKINHLDIEVVRFYQKIQKNIGNELASCIGSGQSLSQAITNTSLSKKISKQLSVIFDIENPSIRSEVVESTIGVLSVQIKKQAKKISILMLLIRNLFLFSAILFFVGVYATGLSL